MSTEEVREAMVRALERELESADWDGGEPFVEE
jgi:hypothetical protein